MKKYLLMFAFLLGTVSTSQALTKTPKDDKGLTVNSLDLVGVQTCRVTSADTTSGKLCSNAPAIVYGVIASSDAATNFMVFRDSATANTSSTVNNVVWFQGNGAAQVVAGTINVKFAQPMKFTNGVSVNMNATIPAGTQSEWVVLYRKLSEN